MEIDVTSLFTSDTWSLAGSVATHGSTAANDTWAASCAEAKERPILTTDAELQALRDHVEASGFGEAVQAYDADQCNALMVQLVALDKRECGLDDVEIDGDDDRWSEYEADAEEGRVPSNIFRSGGKVYFTLSN